MLWETLLAARLVEVPELTRALAQVFRVAPAAVLVIDDLRELEHDDAADRASLIVHRVPTTGDFRMQLSIIPQVAGFEGEDMERGLALSRALRMTILLPDDEDGGDALWIALRPSGSIDRVELDEAVDGGLRIVQRGAPIRDPIPA